MKKWYSLRNIFTTVLYYMEDSRAGPGDLFTPITNIGFIKKYRDQVIHVQTDEKVHLELSNKGIRTCDSAFF